VTYSTKNKNKQKQKQTFVVVEREDHYDKNKKIKIILFDIRKWMFVTGACALVVLVAVSGLVMLR
jgi:hypothetical protein